MVDPGLIEVDIEASSADLRSHGEIELAGPDGVVARTRTLSTPVTVLDV